jgi:hypothetical protein
MKWSEKSGPSADIPIDWDSAARREVLPGLQVESGQIRL